MIPLAAVRNDVADFVAALITGYTLIILAYIVINLIFAFGARPGYYRWLDAVLPFLREVAEPYLRIFRRILPPLGPLDLSPVVGIFFLFILMRVVDAIFDRFD